MHLSCTLADWLQHGPKLYRHITRLTIIDRPDISTGKDGIEKLIFLHVNASSPKELSITLLAWAEQQAHEARQHTLDHIHEDYTLPPRSGHHASLDGLFTAPQLHAIAEELELGKRHRKLKREYEK